MGATLKGRKTISYGQQKHRVYMLENFDLNGWRPMQFNGRFDQIGIIVRDPYNWMASTWRQERNSPTRYITEPWPEETRREKGFPKWFSATLGHRDMMIQHLKQILGDHDLLGEPVYGVNYTSWIQDVAYRQSVAAHFGVEKFTDKGLKEMPPHGGGSSWSKRRVPRLGETVNRWEEYVDDSQYRELLIPELRVLGERYFGMECPW